MDTINIQEGKAPSISMTLEQLSRTQRPQVFQGRSLVTIVEEFDRMAKSQGGAGVDRLYIAKDGIVPDEKLPANQPWPLEGVTIHHLIGSCTVKEMPVCAEDKLQASKHNHIITKNDGYHLMFGMIDDHIDVCGSHESAICNNLMISSRLMLSTYGKERVGLDKLMLFGSLLIGRAGDIVKANNRVIKQLKDTEVSDTMAHVILAKCMFGASLRYQKKSASSEFLEVDTAPLDVKQTGQFARNLAGRIWDRTCEHKPLTAWDVLNCGNQFLKPVDYCGGTLQRSAEWTEWLCKHAEAAPDYEGIATITAEVIQ